MAKKKYKLDEFDCNLLREARHRIDRVKNYNDGAPHSRSVINRLVTLLYKIDDLLEEAEE